MGRLLVFVLVITAACGDDGGPGGPGSPDAALGASAKQFCVQETNRYRAMKGKAAVTENAALEAYADTGAMIDFSSAPHNHFSSTSGGGIAFAENECPQQGNWNLSFGNGDLSMTVAACVNAFFMEGPGGGHYENMMGNYATLGCGIYVQGQKLTIFQDYGH
jgi:hypothetical protein